MRRMMTTAFGALLLSAAGALAQPYPAPVPNASGSQATNPLTYGDTAGPGTMAVPGEPLAIGTCAPSPNASGSLATNPCSYGNRGTAPGMDGMATGSIVVQPEPMIVPGPVPNASGSQTTNPATYGNTLPQ